MNYNVMCAGSSPLGSKHMLFVPSVVAVALANVTAKPMTKGEEHAVRLLRGN